MERPAIGDRLVHAITVAARQPNGQVLVTGAGGFGKTTLAAWACQQVIRLFPDGVLWVELGPRPDQQKLVDILTDQITLLTGVSSRYATVSGAADAFGAALADRKVLLVLDDVWRSQDVEPFLRGGSRCVRLVTTRRPPIVQGCEVPVDAMTSDEGAAMLQHATETSPAELRPLLSRCGVISPALVWRVVS